MAQLESPITEASEPESLSKQFTTFVFPQIHDNMDGWGPCEVPEQFKDTPYQPFSKDDRLGKVCRHVACVAVWVRGTDSQTVTRSCSITLFCVNVVC